MPYHQQALSIEELGLYANSSSQWLTNRETNPYLDELWWQLKTFVASLIQEEFKWGPLPRGAKYQVLDDLIANTFPPSLPLDRPRWLLDYAEQILNAIPELQRIANVPGTCEIGRALLKFTNDIVAIGKNRVRVIDIFPRDLTTMNWWSPVIHELKFRMMLTYVDEPDYYLFSPAPGGQLKKERYQSIQITDRQLYIAAQFWHAGIVNTITTQERKD